jgi:DNA-binding MarR family transcriptional regulator
MTDPRVELGELWRELNRTIHERFRHHFRGMDLHPGTMFLLRHLASEPGLTVSELARRAGVVKSGVSKVIDQVSQKGMVEKCPDPADQRLLRLFLTEQGRATLADLEAKGRAVWLEMVEQIPDAHLADVAKGLRILQAAVCTATPSRGEEDA